MAIQLFQGFSDQQKSLIFFLGWFYYRLLELPARTKKLDDVYWPVFTSLLVLTIISFFDTSLTNPMVRWFALIQTAMAIQLFQGFSDQQKSGARKLLSGNILVPGLVLLVFSVVAAAGVSRYLWADHYYAKCMDELGRGQYTRCYEPALKLAPTGYHSLMLAGISLSALDPKESLQVFEKAQNIFKYVPLIDLELIKLHLRRHDWASAKKTLQDGLKLYPHYEGYETYRYLESL
jgi:hypothetical protein